MLIKHRMSCICKRGWNLERCEDGGWDIYVDGDNIGWAKTKREAKHNAKRYLNPAYISKEQRAEMNRLTGKQKKNFWRLLRFQKHI